MRMTYITRIISISSVASITPRPVGEVAFWYSRLSAIDIIQVPTPGGPDELECALWMTDLEVPFNLDAGDEGGDVGHIGAKFGIDRSDGRPVCGEVCRDAVCACIGCVEETKSQSHAVCILWVEGSVVRTLFESATGIIPEMGDDG